jgi:long-chain-fatty-acid--CoA ligase ACSBG
MANFKGKGKLWITDPRDDLEIRMGKEGVSAIAPKTVMEVFKTTVDKVGRKPALRIKRNNNWVEWTWKQYYDEVLQFGRALIHVGLQPRQCISILGFNSPEWFIADLGAIAAGGIAAGIYTTNGPDACKYILEHSESVVVVVENEHQLNKILAIRPGLPFLKAIVQWSGDVPKVEGVFSWKDFMDLANNVPNEEIERRIQEQKPTQCCTLIYTSGTTGPPKAVMISHDNLMFTASSGIEMQKFTPNEVMISYLPLSHIAAQIVDIHGPLMLGCTIHFAQPDALKGSLSVTLKEVRPTAFLAVPRVWEKIQEKMREVGRNSSGLKLAIASWAKAVGLEGAYAKQNRRSTPWGWWVASKVVFKPVSNALGFDRCRFAVSSAAPISRDTLEYFFSLNIPVLEVYGMSECTGPETANLTDAFKIGSAGRPLPGTELKIDKPDSEGNGEICWRGRNVFMGYMKNDAATAETVDEEGYLHSGDIGKIDEDGFLWITGRIKELIITAGGENIPPVLIEDELKNELGSVIANVMVIGDRRKFLSCLFTIRAAPKKELVDGQYPFTNEIHPDARRVLEEIGSEAVAIEDAKKCPKLQKWLENGMNRFNKRATSNAQQVRKFLIADEDFAIENDLLTPTMKLKRRIVLQRYGPAIDKMYEEAEAAGAN